ncbi:MAG: hypothetical protein VYB54_06660 [Pseudomonadota bacterium]|nr:hypothetical protein [Pseudomonadota bacterium]
MLFLAFFALVVWPGLYALHRLPGPVLRAFAPMVSSEPFLAGQWNNFRASCSSLIARRHLDLLVVGNSHADRSIDMYELARAYPGQNVGLCAWPAWDSGYFGPFMAFLDRFDVTVDRMIWIADLGSLNSPGDGLLTKLRTAFEVHLRDDAANMVQWLEWSARDALFSAPLGISIDARNETILRQARAHDHIDPRKADAIVTRYPLPARDRLIYLVTQTGAQRNPELAADLHDLCRILEAQNTRLDVVIYPVLDITREIISESAGRQTPDTASELQNALSCVDSIFERPIADWGLDIRHFINLNRPYTLDIWQDPESFSAKFSSLETSRQKMLLDFDHTNALGAKIFTEKLIEILDKSKFAER